MLPKFGYFNLCEIIKKVEKYERMRWDCLYGNTS